MFYICDEDEYQVAHSIKADKQWKDLFRRSNILFRDFRNFLNQFKIDTTNDFIREFLLII